MPDDQMLPAAEAMGLGKAAHRAVGAFVRAMRELEDIMDVSTPGELVREVVDKVGFEAYVSDQENGDERWGFVKELIAVAGDSDAFAPPFGVSDDVSGDDSGDEITDEITENRAESLVGADALHAFLEGISLLMSAETRSEDETVDAARLMTLHASKGLEFSTVLVAGCEDGLIPFKRDERTGQPEDEETRLFYVGVTRAKRKLFLCRAFKRQRFGKTEYCEPSPFLDVIKNALAPGGAPGGAPASARESPGGAAHNASGGGTRIAMGSSPAFRGRGRGVPGRGGRGGAGGGGDKRGPGGAETKAPADPEANARRAARRAAAAKKAAEAAAKSAEGRGAPRVGPRAQPRSRRPSE